MTEQDNQVDEDLDPNQDEETPQEAPSDDEAPQEEDGPNQCTLAAKEALGAASWKIEAMLRHYQTDGTLTEQQCNNFRAMAAGPVQSLVMLVDSMEQYLRGGLIVPRQGSMGQVNIVVPPPGGFRR